MNVSNIDNIHSFNNGATSSNISSLELEFGYSLPSDYVQLLEEADGFILKNGLLIYSTKDIYERNTTLEVNEYAPGYIAIGDDSGGVSIMMNIYNKNVFIVDQSSMDPDDMEKVADTLDKWLLSGCLIE